jgi:hypothetical protein
MRFDEFSRNRPTVIEASAFRHSEGGAPLQNFKFDLACVRAQSVTSYRIATFCDGCGRVGEAVVF